MKRKRVVSVGFAVIAVTALGLTTFEIHHQLRFGHYVAYGVHADVVESSGDIGVPGINTFYAVRVSNYTLSPLKLVGWEYRSDFLAAPPSFGCRFQVQKFSPQAGHWIVVMDFGPTGASQFPVVVRNLYPLGSIVAVQSLPVGAVDNLRKGDQVRFAVFTNLNAAAVGVYTRPLKIKEVRQQRPVLHALYGDGWAGARPWRMHRASWEICKP